MLNEKRANIAPRKLLWVAHQEYLASLVRPMSECLWQSVKRRK